MKLLVKRVKKHPEDFRLIDLLYVPNTFSDWIFLAILALIFAFGVFIINQGQVASRQVIEKRINQEVALKTRQEISALRHLTAATFLQYLTGYWQSTSQDQLWEIHFTSPTMGELVIISHDAHTKEIIPIHIITTSPPLGMLDFYTTNPKEQGYIRKIWNRDAIVVLMPPAQNPVTLYYMLSNPTANVREP